MFKPLVLMGHSIHTLQGIDNDAINEAVMKRKDLKLDDNTAAGNTFTEDSYYPVDDPACKRLLEEVDKIIAVEVNKYFKTFNTWAHILEPNEATMYHSHEQPGGPPGISWVYYSKTPKNSGNIVWVIDCLKSKALVEHKPEVGQLVLFPDNVPHFTKKNVSGETRISISGNAKPEEKDFENVVKEPHQLFNYIGIFNS